MNCRNTNTPRRTRWWQALALLTGGLLTPAITQAQAGQCLGGGCAGPGTGYGTAQSTTSSSFVNAVAGTWGGEYNTYNVTSGQQYEWSLCTGDGATNPSSDMTMTLKNTSLQYPALLQR